MKFFVAFAVLVAVAVARPSLPAVADSPVVIGPYEGAPPLVQIIVNVAKPAPVDQDQIPADDVQIADNDDDVTSVEIADLPAPPVKEVEIADLPPPPVSDVAVGAPDQPSPAIN